MAALSSHPLMANILTARILASIRWPVPRRLCLAHNLVGCNHAIGAAIQVENALYRMSIHIDNHLGSNMHG